MMANIGDMDLLDVPKIKVFGIGDFGTRVIKSVQETELPNVQCFLVQLGETLEEESILDKMRGGDLEFIVADMEEDAGGQTAYLAKYAKKIGVPAVGWMRGRVLDKTEGGYSRFEELKNSMVSVIVVPGNVTDAETIIAMGIKGIGSVVGSSGNLDFSDVEPIFSHGGLGIIALGEAEGEQSAADAVRKAVTSFPTGISFDGAKSVLLIHVTPIGQELGIEECNAAMLELQKSLHAEANTIMSNYQEKGADGSIKAMIIATNFE